MALQGTLDTFALADLVRLLATTGKTGELSIDGDRGHGSLWFVDGALVAGRPAADDVTDAVFALLRMVEGDFHFAAEARTDDAGEPQSALDALGAAETRLEEWKPVEQLVPTPLVTLTLRDDLTSDEVTISRDVWRRLRLVAGGTTAGAFGDALELDDVGTGFAVRDLVDAGLVEVGEPAPEAESESEAESEAEPVAATLVVEPIAGGDDVADEPAAAPDLADVVALTPEPLARVLPDEDRYQLGDWEDPEELARPLIPTAAEVAEAEAEALADPLAVVEAAAAEPTVAEASGPEHPVLSDAEAGGDRTEVAPSALGPWEPLTPAALAPSEPTPPEDEADEPVIAEVAATPAPTTDLPAEPGSLDVDLDRQLGDGDRGHSYLGTNAAPAGLPEPLLGGPEPLLGGPEPLLGAPAPAEAPPAPEAAADRSDELPAEAPAHVERPWGTPEVEGPLPLDSLSPAAARAVTAAAHGDRSTEGDTDAGRRVLRRIISTGKA